MGGPGATKRRHDRRTVTAVLTIFLRVVEQVLCERAPGAVPKVRLGVVRLILVSAPFPYYVVAGLIRYESLALGGELTLAITG